MTRGLEHHSGSTTRCGASPLPSIASVVVIAFLIVGCRQFPAPKVSSDLERQGREIFRHDTFGNEQFWTDTARLHEFVDRHLQPLEALSLGFKVDMAKLNLAKFILHNPF